MDKGFRYRIYPNASQRDLIERTFGCCRWVYNQALEMRKDAWEIQGSGMSANDCIRRLPAWKRSNPWLSEVDAVALQQSVRDCDRAFRNFFRRCKAGGKPGYPRFKSAKDPHRSYRTQNPAGRKAIEVLEASDRIKLPKLGLVKARVSRPVEGRIVNATVSRDAAGRYFVTACCTDVPVSPLPPNDRATGIDLGIANHVTCSDGTVIENPRNTKRYAKKLAIEQRRLSRKRRGSANWRRQRERVAKVHAKIADSRRDHIHKATTRLVSENQVIAAESLAVGGMLRNHRLAKHVADAAFAEVCRQLGYKCAWYGRTFVQVDAWYPSSRTCSRCGHVNRDLTLADRTWECPECGALLDRDLNAAKNILAEGLGVLKGTAGHAGTGGDIAANASGVSARPHAA